MSRVFRDRKQAENYGYKSANAARPSTPLPWRVASHQSDNKTPVIRRNDDADTTGVAVLCVNRLLGEKIPSKAERANAAYIVHACNAYPRLVAALRRSEAGIDLARAYVSGETAADLYRVQQSAAALLRELGEQT